ncbi:recombinase family protein [Oscillibacter sp.]|uniref:recombinase family protein n=1 Tax=Oscillibacter sp. TaxID=1945593 RepID=UPI0028ABA3E2|nr:recombinase family protein [Oscillibacter sp.]
MPSNRKLPFGYCLRNGEIILQKQEIECVSLIFCQYAAGASYQELVKRLNAGGIPYDAGKPWNINMVARIIGNTVYIGEKGYPAIVPADLFRAAQEARSQRTSPQTITPLQKALRRLCRGLPPEGFAKQVITILNDLTENPSQIKMPVQETAESIEIRTLQNKLEELLNQQPLDEQQAKETAMALAAAQYDAIGNAAYETERLRRIFADAKSTPVPDAELLRMSVQSITRMPDDGIALTLKNGQIIERNPAP